MTAALTRPARTRTRDELRPAADISTAIGRRPSWLRSKLVAGFAHGHSFGDGPPRTRSWWTTPAVGVLIASGRSLRDQEKACAYCRGRGVEPVLVAGSARGRHR